MRDSLHFMAYATDVVKAAYNITWHSLSQSGSGFSMGWDGTGHPLHPYGRKMKCFFSIATMNNTSRPNGSNSPFKDRCSLIATREITYLESCLFPDSTVALKNYPRVTNLGSRQQSALMKSVPFTETTSNYLFQFS